MSDDEELPDNEPWLRELLQAERSRGALSPALSDAIAGRLQRTLGVSLDRGGGGTGQAGTGQAGTGQAGAERAAARAPGGFFGALSIAFGLGALCGAGAMWWVATSPAPTVERAVVPLPAGVPAPPPARADVETAPPRAKTSAALDAAPTAAVVDAGPPELARGPQRDKPRASLERDRRLRAERALLELARTAFERGRAQEADTALREHARRFADGQLREERESLRVPVLVELGRHDEARRVAARFRERYPASLFRPMVDAALRSIP